MTCQLCPRTGGAFKQTSNGQWVHVQCAVAIPELKAPAVSLVERADLSKIPSTRRSLRCSWCKKRKPHRREQVRRGSSDPSQQGVCVQCSHSNCTTAFHVTCAQRDMLLYAKMTQPSDAEGFHTSDDTGWEFCCVKHRPSGPQAN